MVQSPLTQGSIPHHNKFSSRYGASITRVIVHHWAGTVGGDVSLADPNRNASVHYIIYSDGTLKIQVPEEYRAWTSGGPAADNPSITVEMQNSSTRVYPDAWGRPNNDDPRSWAVSDAAVAKLVELISDIARRYNWGAIDRGRVRGHREFDATACPGGFLWHRLEAIAAAADQINNGPAPVPEIIKKRKKKMFLAYFKNALGEGQPAWAFFGPGFYLPLNTKESVVKFKAQIGMEEDSFDCRNSALNWRRFQDSTGLDREQIELMDEAAK